MPYVLAAPACLPAQARRSASDAIATALAGPQANIGNGEEGGERRRDQATYHRVEWTTMYKTKKISHF